MLCVQIWMLVVQFLGLMGLIWYAYETRRMRKASEEQVRISQGLIRASMDQVEGLSKPCLTLASGLRDANDAILEMHGAVGNTVARGDAGSFIMQNIGNGIALNVAYQFLTTPRDDPARRRHAYYLQNILPSQEVTMPQPMTAYTGDWELRIGFSSIGGRRYQSMVTLKDRVLTGFQFSDVDEVGDLDDFV